MFALILIFSHLNAAPTPSAHALLYPSKDLCAAAGPGIANYQAGYEASKPQPSDVYWYCIPVKPVLDAPTT